MVRPSAPYKELGFEMFLHALTKTRVWREPPVKLWTFLRPPEVKRISANGLELTEGLLCNELELAGSLTSPSLHSPPLHPPTHPRPTPPHHATPRHAAPLHSKNNLLHSSALHCTALHSTVSPCIVFQFFGSFSLFVSYSVHAHFMAACVI